MNHIIKITENDINEMTKRAVSLLTESLNEDGEDFGVNVKGELTIDDIKQGEVVYHRPKDSRDSNPLSVINSLMNIHIILNKKIYHYMISLFLIYIYSSID